MKKTFFVSLCLMLFVLSLMSFDEAQAAATKYKCYKLYFNGNCFYNGNFNYKTWDFNYVGLYTVPSGLYYDVD